MVGKYFEIFLLPRGRKYLIIELIYSHLIYANLNHLLGQLILRYSRFFVFPEKVDFRNKFSVKITTLKLYYRDLQFPRLPLNHSPCEIIRLKAPRDSLDILEISCSFC